MFKHWKEILEAQQRFALAPSTYYAPQVDIYKGVPVVLDSDCLAAKFGVVDSIACCALVFYRVFDFNGQRTVPKIVVNNAFASLDADLKKAFFEHEIAHLELHSDLQVGFSIAKIEDIIFGKGSYLQKEYEADYHAFKQVGISMIKALETFLASDLNWQSKRLIKHRIKRLQQLA